MKRQVFLFLIYMFFSVSCESPYMVRHPVSPGDVYYLYATYYGDEFEGRETADGSIFSQNELTCAARGFPFGTYLEIASIDTGRKVVVKVTDRLGKNVIDLSRKAFGEIDDIRKEKIAVKVKVVDRDKVRHTSTVEKKADRSVSHESSFYTVQVFSFGSIGDAKNAEKDLDLDCYIFSKDGRFYVRCGGFATSKEAEKFRTEKLSDKKDAVIIEVSN